MDQYIVCWMKNGFSPVEKLGPFDQETAQKIANQTVWPEACSANARDKHDLLCVGDKHNPNCPLPDFAVYCTRSENFAMWFLGVAIDNLEA